MKIRTQILLITLFCLFITLKGVAQYYSKRINFYNQNNSTAEFILVNDTFYLSTGLIDSGEGILGKVSVTGNISMTPKYAAAFVGSYYQPIQTISYRGKFYTAGGGGYFSKVSSSFYKFNSNGDTLQTHYYGDTAYSQLVERIIPYYKTKNKLLLIGATDSTCGPGHQGTYKPMIRVVDTNGVLYQTKLYLGNCFYRNITSVDTAENKGYLIGYIGMFSTWDLDSRILKLDSNLNIVWNKQINVTAEGAPDIVNHKNKYYTVVSTKVDSVWNFSYKWERVSLTRLDLNGNIIWQKYYGVKERPIITSGIKECANGDYIMCGSHYKNQLMGWIMRTDSAGNLKWWKDYRPDTSPVLDTLAQNYLYDIMELPNGDIAAVGWAGGSQISPLQQTWLLKVDSNGCEGSIPCSSNVGISEAGALEAPDKGLRIYPNPANENLTLALSEGEGTEQVTIEITNTLGQLVLKETCATKTSAGSVTTTLNINYLKAGLYYLSVKTKDKTATQKIMIQK